MTCCHIQEIGVEPTLKCFVGGDAPCYTEMVRRNLTAVEADIFGILPGGLQAAARASERFCRQRQYLLRARSRRLGQCAGDSANTDIQP